MKTLFYSWTDFSARDNWFQLNLQQFLHNEVKFPFLISCGDIIAVIDDIPEHFHSVKVNISIPGGSSSVT